MGRHLEDYLTYPAKYRIRTLCFTVEPATLPRPPERDRRSVCANNHRI